MNNDLGGLAVQRPEAAEPRRRRRGGDRRRELRSQRRSLLRPRRLDRSGTAAVRQRAASATTRCAASPVYSEDLNIFKVFPLANGHSIRFESMFGNIFNRTLFVRSEHELERGELRPGLQSGNSAAIDSDRRAVRLLASRQAIRPPVAHSRAPAPERAAASRHPDADGPPRPRAGDRSWTGRWPAGSRRTFALVAVVCGVLGSGALALRRRPAGAAERGRAGPPGAPRRSRQAGAARARRSRYARRRLFGPRHHPPPAAAARRQRRGFFEEALRLEPGLLGAHINLAQVYVLPGKADRALDVLRRALTADPSLAPAAAATWAGVPGVPVAALGEVRAPAHRSRRRGRRDRHPRARRRRRARRPTRCPFNLGSAYVLAREPARALDTYDAALRVTPDALAALRQAAGDRRAAGRARTVAVLLDPREASSPRTIPTCSSASAGSVCDDGSARGRRAGARRRPPALKPDDAVASVHAGRGQGRQASVRSRAGAARTAGERRVRSDPQLQYALGAVLYTQGRLDDARDASAESVRLQPEQLASQSLPRAGGARSGPRGGSHHDAGSAA